MSTIQATKARERKVAAYKNGVRIGAWDSLKDCGNALGIASKIVCTGAKYGIIYKKQFTFKYL